MSIYKKILAIALILVGIFFTGHGVYAKNNVTIIVDQTKFANTDTTITVGVDVFTSNQNVILDWKYGKGSTPTTPGNSLKLLDGTGLGLDHSFPVLFELTNLDPGSTYTLEVFDDGDKAVYLTVPGLTTKDAAGLSSDVTANLDGTVHVTDTSLRATYSVDTGGKVVDLLLKYTSWKRQEDSWVLLSSTTSSQSVTNLAGSPTSATFEATGLEADTLYEFQLLDANGDIPVSISNRVTTPSAGSFGIDIYADLGQGGCPDDRYCYLAPLGDTKSIDTSGQSIADYLIYIFKFGIGIVGVLALLMFILGSIEYMGSESFFNKEEAKGKMGNAVVGVILALGSFVLLNTINPDLVNLKLNIQKQEITLEGDSNDPVGDVSSFSTISSASGLSCPGTGGKTQVATIANTFVGKVTYRFGAKGAAGPDNTVLLDCSGFVNRILQCAGMTFTNTGTAGIFTGSEAVTAITASQVNGIDLQPGDLVGWRAGDGGESTGHVMIYVGDGKVMDSHGPHDIIGKAVGSFDTDGRYKNRIKFIKRAP